MPSDCLHEDNLPGIEQLTSSRPAERDGNHQRDGSERDLRRGPGQAPQLPPQWRSSFSWISYYPWPAEFVIWRLGRSSRLWRPRRVYGYSFSTVRWLLVHPLV